MYIFGNIVIKAPSPGVRCICTTDTYHQATTQSILLINCTDSGVPVWMTIKIKTITRNANDLFVQLRYGLFELLWLRTGLSSRWAMHLLVGVYTIVGQGDHKNCLLITTIHQLKKDSHNSITFISNNIQYRQEQSSNHRFRIKYPFIHTPIYIRLLSIDLPLSLASDYPIYPTYILLISITIQNVI